MEQARVLNSVFGILLDSRGFLLQGIDRNVFLFTFLCGAGADFLTHATAPVTAGPVKGLGAGTHKIFVRICCGKDARYDKTSDDEGEKRQQEEVT